MKENGHKRIRLVVIKAEVEMLNDAGKVVARQTSGELPVFEAELDELTELKAYVESKFLKES